MQTERWLVTGASGQLGAHVVRMLATQGANLIALARGGDCGTPGVAQCHVDLAASDALRGVVLEHRPSHIVHLGAMTAVNDCYGNPAAASQINVEATRVLADAAGVVGARLVFSSTDMVFDGAHAPYHESDATCPLSVYGASKVAAERVLLGFPRTVVVRIPLMYGFALNGRRTTFAAQIAALRAGEPLRLFVDEWRTCVWLADAARALIGLARSNFSGLIHLAGPERLSRFDLIERCAALLGLPTTHLVPISRLDAAAPEPRPADLSLDGSRFAQAFPPFTPRALGAHVFAQ